MRLVYLSSRQLAETGQKRVGAATSHEKGTIVTTCYAVSATGNRTLPFCKFPRKKTKDIWKEMLPPGSWAEAHPLASGWMTTDNFLSFLKHFTQYSKPSQEHHFLLLLDNHSSHISIGNIEFCADNNIHLLSFPPHCSRELQPLDKSV